MPSEVRRPIRALGALLLATGLLAPGLAVAGPTTAPAGADAIDALVRDRLARADAPPGFALAILDQGRPTLVRSYGLANLEQTTPVDEASVFPIASITKTFTALAILLLEQDGRLATGDPLARFLPDFPNAGRITLRDLLVHTSGIAEFTQLPPFATDQARDWRPDELIALVAAAPPLDPPGQVCRYSDSGYILLGRVVELASGQSFMDYVREHVARRLAMPSIVPGSHQALILRRADGYARAGQAWDNAPYVSLEAPWAAGGLMGRVGDLVNLAQALRPDGPLLRPASYQAMVAPVILKDGQRCRLPLPGAEATYGYGLEIVRFDDLPEHRAIGKSGVFPGYSGYVAAFEGTGLTVAALANADGSLPFTVETVHELARLLLRPPAP